MISKNLNSVGATMILAGVVFMGTSKLLSSAKSHIEIAKLDREVAKLEKELASYD